jgi:predicted ATPase
MLSLPNDGRYPTLDMVPQQRRQKTMEALTAQVEALCRQKPVLMIFEDAHWADPTSLEAFGRAVDRITTRGMLIVTHRPEFQPPWIGRPYVTALTLNRLGGREIAAIIDGVTGNKLLSPGLRQDIIERTDGVPLFVEEMTKAVLEAESEGAARQAAAAIPSAALAVPASLHASLMARLDRLGAAKEVAQIGATIGRDFSHALLDAVAHKPQLELAAALERLLAAGLLFRQGVPPYATYLFKHALVQDTAYGTLLREPRRSLHARIVEILESQFQEIAETQPELLARHCSEAGLIEKAAGLWAKAGYRSLARSALVEGVEQLTRALAHIATLPATSARRSEQINLQVALITPLMHVKGHAAPETRAAAERARLLIEEAEALGETQEDPLLLFSVLYGFWVGCYVGFKGVQVRELAEQFSALADKQPASGPRMIAHRLMGISRLFTGEVAAARAHYDSALALYDPAEHRALASRFGHDSGVAIFSYRPFALWLLGYPDAALRDTEAALRIARELGQAATLMYALAHVGVPNMLCGCYDAAAAQTREVLALAEEKSAPHWRAFGMLNEGWLLASTGRAAEAVPLIADGIAAYRASGSTNWLPLRLSYLALAHAEIGQVDEAWRCIEEAANAVASTNESWCDAEVNRSAGEIALRAHVPDAAKAETYFERALKIARAQQAKSWELRAAMSMARVWRDQGKPQQARELLAPVYGWFTEGFDTRDLKEAKALLDELAGPPRVTVSTVSSARRS